MAKKLLPLFTCLVLGALSLAAQEQNGQWRGYFKTVPLHGNTPQHVLEESGSGLTLPMFSLKGKSSRDGNIYNTIIVGNLWDPSQIFDQTTYLPTVVIPLIVKMPDGGVLDPTITAYDPNCNAVGVPLTLTENSPLLKSAPFVFGGTDVGNTQYIDAFQRAEFWEYIPSIVCTNSGGSGGSIIDLRLNPGNGPCYRDGSLRWHTVFNVQVAPAQTYSPTLGQTYTVGTCGQAGVIDYSELVNYVENNLLAGLGVKPTQYPIILMRDVVEADGGLCCILGFHDAYGTPMQIYSIAEFDTSGIYGPSVQDVAPLSHELAEGINDPTGIDPTPAWGHIGQQQGCQGNYEVGDPLSGTLMPPVTLNGFTYHVQELAFYSWFFGAPTAGVNGWYSSNNTFTHDAGGVCH